MTTAISYVLEGGQIALDLAMAFAQLESSGTIDTTELATDFFNLAPKKFKAPEGRATLANVEAAIQALFNVFLPQPTPLPETPAPSPATSSESGS